MKVNKIPTKSRSNDEMGDADKTFSGTGMSTRRLGGFFRKDHFARVESFAV